MGESKRACATVNVSADAPALTLAHTDRTFDFESTLAAKRWAPKTYAGSKRQLNNWLYSRIENQFELEARIQQEMADSHGFMEGVVAFIEKRPAHFRGA
jgi:enoyl-CoA hydratase/carnithine racemase